MISNTDSIPFVYSKEHIRVKVYLGSPSNGFSRDAGMHRLMGFWRVQIRAQGAPDRFHLTKPNTFPSTIEKPASLRSDGDRDHPGMPFGFLSEQQRLRPNPPIASAPAGHSRVHAATRRRRICPLVDRELRFRNSNREQSHRDPETTP